MKLLFAPLLLVVAAAQAPIKNPSGLAFTCPDHAVDISHEVAIVRESDGAIVLTVQGGDPPLNANNEVVVPLNVHPVTFGRYRFKARVSAIGPEGVAFSDWSELSDVWERAPGKVVGLTVR